MVDTNIHSIKISCSYKNYHHIFVIIGPNFWLDLSQFDLTKADMTFTDHLNHFVSRSQYSTGQLASLTGLAQRTIANWLQGHVSRPRHVLDLLKLGVSLHLSQQEMNILLQSARHPPLEHLHETLNNVSLLSFWQPSPPIPFQVGPLLPYFVGRDAEIETLCRHLTNVSENRACVIYGMGGVGKTTLATRIAYELRGAFKDGVL